MNASDTSRFYTSLTDATKFHPDGRVAPIEYKLGRRRARRADDLQLCAQAMCLEEMNGQAVPEGTVFHAPERRRRRVIFTPELRAAVEQAAADVRAMLATSRLPAPRLLTPPIIPAGTAVRAQRFV